MKSCSVVSRALQPSALALIVSVVSLAAPATVAVAASPGPKTAAAAATDQPSPAAELEWRNVGPVNMSGRVSDVEGIPGNPNVLYVGSASGGVWKTVDGGLRFAPIFDDQPIASIGDLALAPSNPEVVYVGSGEANVRNSVSFGNGVYKSTDGGDSWTYLGLRESRHISRVLVHPSNPDVVYVGALGRMSGANDERGVFRSVDGGESWEKVLFVDDRHGVADMDMDPSNPNILYAALWHFERKPWTHRSGSEEGGVWKSVDGGTTWQKLEAGLPKLAGRLAVKVAPSDPRVVYVMAESDDGVLFRSTDRGKSFEKVSDDVRIVSRGFYYTDLRVDPSDANRVYAISSRLFVSIDGGKTFDRISHSTHVDYHSLWIDPLNPRRIWQGQDGGVAVSYDRGESWEPIRNLPIAQLYQVFHDQREPFYFVGGGLQDNGTWYGPSRTREPGGILEDDWRMMSFGDAYFVVPHAEQEDLFLSEYQAGGIVRTDMRTRQQMDVSPQPRRNDGGPASELPYRFNWNAPIVASPHDPGVVYFAGNVVFRSEDFGDSWEVISPDLTTDDESKQGEAGGPAWTENTTAEYHCTLISFAESPAEAGVLWAGSDDGLLHLSRDGGETWTEVGKNVPGLPAESSVSHIEPDHRSAGAAVASFDRHLLDDYGPHLYRTSDFGATWTSISAGLPEEGWIWVVRQDPKNPDLLWVGTELGLYASYDGGDSWRTVSEQNLPTVAVHDILVHPRDNDLILGTHGRAIWIFDDATPLQQLAMAEEGAEPHLFDVRPALRFPTRFTRYGLGDKEHRAPNPPSGALITYYLPADLGQEARHGDSTEAPIKATEEDDADPPLRLEILDGEGTVLRTMKDLETSKGLHRLAWDLAMDPPRPRREGAPETSEFDPGPRGPMVLPGTYTVRLTVDGAEGDGDARVMETAVEVRMDPLVEVALEDLERQQHMASRLVELTSEVNDALRAFDILASQLEARRETARLLEIDLSDDLEGAWEAHDKAVESVMNQLTRQEGKPFWSQGPRLSERLAGLFGNVDDQFAAPTQAQRDYLAELEAEWSKLRERVSTSFEEEVPSLNAQLEAAGIPPAIIPSWQRSE